MVTEEASPSKSQVNKAGKTLRRISLLAEPPRPESGVLWAHFDVNEYRRAQDVLTAFRAAHVRPLGKANMGLRSMVKSEGCRVEVSQRLKRLPTIIDKLLREPTMALGNMGDIGGCRAVLDSIDEVRRVEARVKHRRPPVQHHDYIANPRESGYRAVHLIVEYDQRRIEVQLRTRVMHEWAFTVERLAGRTGQDVKGGRGPREVVELLRVIAEAMAIEETGGVVDAILRGRILSLRAAAEPYLMRGERT
jgi:putative GTP pyrophosphokinase